MTADVIVVAALRHGAIAIAVYLVGLTLLHVMLRLLRAHRAARTLDRLTPRLVRHTVALLLGAGLAVPTASAADEPANDPPVVMHRLPDATTSEVTAPAPPPAPSPPTPAPALETTWTIKPGEHFWAVAEAVVMNAIGRPPTDAEVVPYWRSLIEANRSRLVDRDNPDLVYPAQVFVLPETDGRIPSPGE
jgi:nucleoid-associated protein YgaU